MLYDFLRLQKLLSNNLHKIPTVMLCTHWLVKFNQRSYIKPVFTLGPTHFLNCWGNFCSAKMKEWHFKRDVLHRIMQTEEMSLFEEEKCFQFFWEGVRMSNDALSKLAKNYFVIITLKTTYGGFSMD
jgi:hypothetical protein